MKSKSATQPLSMNDLVGYYWMYNTNIHKVIRIEEEGDQVHVITDKKTIKVKKDKTQQFISELLPVDQAPGESMPAPYQGEMVKPDIESDNPVAYLKGVLMESIKKVRENKEYIPQAQEISKTVDSMVKLVQLEIKLSRKGI